MTFYRINAGSSWTLLYLILFAPFAAHSQLLPHTLTSGQRERIYYTFQPEGLGTTKKYPLLLVLHGGGGDARGIAKLTGFIPLAERDHFIITFPEGFENSWNDGREAPAVKATAQKIDDVAFLSEVVARCINEMPVDASRVFVTGISNGAMMSLALGIRTSLFRGIAAVCGSLRANLPAETQPPRNCSVLVINGTEDPLVPYGGGFVMSERAKRGKVISTDEMMHRIQAWANGEGEPTKLSLPDRDPDDGCKASKWSYPVKDNWALQLIRIDGGGHTWPGGKQYLPKMIVGRVCRDFKAEVLIWDFFKEQS